MKCHERRNLQNGTLDCKMEKKCIYYKSQSLISRPQNQLLSLELKQNFSRSSSRRYTETSKEKNGRSFPGNGSKGRSSMTKGSFSCCSPSNKERQSPVSLVPRQVGLSEDVKVLTVNGSQDCEHGGKIYHNGDHFEDPKNPCSVCQCSGGEVSCSVITCPSSPSEGCTEVKEEGKCCSSYVCPAISEISEDQKRTESILVDTTTLPTLREEEDETEDPSIAQAQNAVNSLFIHKVILETIKKEQEQERLNEVETTVVSLTELPTSSPEISEPLEISTRSLNSEDGNVASTTPESFSEIDTTSELSLEENLLREVSDVSTIRSETTMTFDPTERSAQEENEVEKSFVTEESTQNEEISINTDASDQRVTTEIPSSDKNVENEASVSTLKTQTSELNEESTLIDALYNDKTEDLFTTAEPLAEATEASVTEDVEAETPVPEAENLLKAAESVITSQTEAYLEENTPERSNVIETTQFYEERDVSTSDYSYVTELAEQTTELQPLEPRLSDNHETFDQVSTISNIEIAEESDGRNAKQYC
ncbi:hypothetical protein Anas_11887 [Armadillidium nasatum]|uniref:VWFC domain-containing protein n=1 Tax=Armadillidium nasatum TaxID=96803 RepID=A0A5N5TME6_9CRUS|nr:hypothetical protein Anas_11887 [Armadillidium nasatum]